MREECRNCHKQTVNCLVEKFDPDENTIGKLNLALDKLYKDENHLSNPEVAAQVQRLSRELLNNTDLYIEEKSKANRMVYSQYHQWRSRIQASESSFHFAARLAVAGNVIDYGAHTVPDDIPKAIELLVKQPLKIDHLNQLEKHLKKAKRVLYLGDNAGEIVFDKLFINLIDHDNLSYVTRGDAVINDVTIEDAHQIGMHNECKVMHNGSDAPSTLLVECSSEFREAYKNADLIISKGMGNFEGLMNEDDPRIFFMLLAKCSPIAELLGVEKGDMVVTQFLS